MYVRTLPVVFADKVKNHRDESVVSYVRSVQQQLQMTFEREIYPYTKFVEKHGLRGEIMFAYQGGMAIEVEGAAAIPLSAVIRDCSSTTQTAQRLYPCRQL